MQRKNIFSKPDKKLFILVVVLTLVGLIALADASAPLAERNFSDKFFFVKQQLVWALAGICLLLIFTKVKYTLWEKIASPLFLASIILLIAVFIPGVGARFLGARRWILLGPLSIQPSEILKLSLAIYMAKLASKGKGYWAFIVPLIIASFLVMLQPDMGTTIVIVGIAMVQMFVSGVAFIDFILTSIVGALGLAFLTLISSYRRERLLTFLHETTDPLGKSYHIRQILLAIGTGGLWGAGLGNSRQKYLFLPETATDSIFAVISEELGFLGSIVLISVFTYFIIKGIGIVKNSPDKFSQILALGIVTWIGGQAFLNIASMLALVPLTGIPLPFISYGGSSLSMTLLASGILLNISRYAKEK